jgi:phospholipid/cholesterol/gamma-HCH transport system substrate-binding protein
VHVVKSHALGGPKPRLGRLALIVQVIAALAFVGSLLHSEGVSLPFTGSGSWSIQAAFSDADGIHTGERIPVLVAGVPEGIVSQVRLQDGAAVATLQLADSVQGVLRSDTTATIEPRSALEDLTVDLTPGSPTAPAARAGMRIAEGRTTPTIPLDRLTAIMDADTRAQVAILLDQLAAGIGGRGGELRAAVAQLAAVVNPARQVTGALARRRILLSSLVGSLARLSQVAESHDQQLATSLAAGADTLSVTSRREGALAQGISSLPGTLTTLDDALNRVRSLADPLAPALSRLDASAVALPGALSALRGAVPTVDGLLGAASALVRDGSGGAQAAAAVFKPLAGTARALTPAIADVAPIVDAVNTDRSGIGVLGARFSGVLSTNDANGPILRGLGTFEAFNPADFGVPNATPAQTVALAAQAVHALTLTCLDGGLVACLVRYLVPGLPGAVRSLATAAVPRQTGR